MISRRALFSVTVIVSYFWIASALDIATKNVELKDLLQIGGKVDIKPTSDTKSFPRSLSGDLESDLEQFFRSNEVAVEVPLIGSTVIFNGRSLDNGEFDFKLNSNSEEEQDEFEDEERKIKIKKIKKHKIRKILTPILVLLVLKAITLIPLALGILGIKTWNALQLSFMSFVVSLVLAVWKFCTKVADFHPTAPTVIHEAVHDVHPTVHEVIHPHILHDHHEHHIPHHHYHDDHHFDHHHHDDHHYDLHDHHLHWRSDDAQNLAYGRSDATSQDLAYNSYAPEANYKSIGGVGEVVPVYKSDMYKTAQDM